MRFFKRWQHVKLHKLESSGWTFAPFCAHFLNRLRALSRAQSQICLGHIGSAGHVLFWISDRKFWQPFGWFSLKRCFNHGKQGWGENFFRFASRNPGSSWTTEKMCLDKLNFWKDQTIPSLEQSSNFSPENDWRLIRRRFWRPFGVQIWAYFSGAVLVRYQGFCQNFHVKKSMVAWNSSTDPKIATTWGPKKLLPWTRWRMPKAPMMRLALAWQCVEK